MTTQEMIRVSERFVQKACEKSTLDNDITSARIAPGVRCADGLIGMKWKVYM
jgi:hypothetical protein